jgi:hypothetical protein
MKSLAAEIAEREAAPAGEYCRCPKRKNRPWLERRVCEARKCRGIKKCWKSLEEERIKS